jgi:ring-1,2-phenylacetyl-CoA epoxidase subunit PaaE
MDHHFYSLQIEEVRQETADTISLIFAPHPSFSSDYLAGQFLTLKAQINGESVRRAYSLCSSPVSDKRLAVSVKKVDGGKMSNWILENAKVGFSIEAMPPIGNFIFQTHASKKRWFMLYAAGSGITPVYSILKTILSTEPQSFVSLMYGSRTQEDIIFKNDLDNWVTKFPSRLKVLHTLSQPGMDWYGERGRIDEELIMHTLEHLKPVTPFEDTVVFMCGPQAMMDTVSQVTQAQGVKKENIHRESFTSSVDELAKASAVETMKITERNIQINLEGKNYKLTVGPKTTILDAALDADIDMPYSCQSGLCTACRGKCLSGKVHMDEREGLSDEEIEEGYVLTCVGHPLTDDVVIEIC